jgi:hypothetical protein
VVHTTEIRSPAIADPVLDLIAKRVELMRSAAEFDRRVISARSASAPEQTELSQAFDAAELAGLALERQIAETPAATLAGLIAKLEICATYFKDVPGGSGCLIAERRVIGALGCLKRRDPDFGGALDRLGKAAEAFADGKEGLEHMVVGAHKDLRRIARGIRLVYRRIAS